MLMSQAAISSGVAARPRSGLCAPTTPQLSPSSAAVSSQRSCIDMLDLPIWRHAPARHAVEMIDAVGAAARDQLGTRRLHITARVDRAALQHGGAAVPAPRDAKARERC